MATFPVTVGTGATQLVGPNPDRTVLDIYNNDTANVFLSKDQQSITTNGTVIPPGTSVTIMAAFGGEPQDPWFAASAAGGANIRVTEHFGPIGARP